MVIYLLVICFGQINHIIFRLINSSTDFFQNGTLKIIDRQKNFFKLAKVSMSATPMAMSIWTTSYGHISFEMIYAKKKVK